MNLDWKPPYGRIYAIGGAAHGRSLWWDYPEPPRDVVFEDLAALPDERGWRRTVSYPVVSYRFKLHDDSPDYVERYFAVWPGTDPVFLNRCVEALFKNRPLPQYNHHPQTLENPVTPETKTEDQQPAAIKPQEPFELDLDDDTPLPQVCNLTDGTCESCQ